MHAAALKHGLTLGADVTFMDIPVCGGHQDDGTPILEIQNWPLLQPHLLAPLFGKIQVYVLTCFNNITFYSKGL